MGMGNANAGVEGLGAGGGPSWTVGKGYYAARNHAVVEVDGARVVAVVVGKGYAVGPELGGWSAESERVARLIAAAPDLYRALRELVDATPTPLANARQRAAFERSLAVLARATGAPEGADAEPEGVGVPTDLGFGVVGWPDVTPRAGVDPGSVDGRRRGAAWLAGEQHRAARKLEMLASGDVNNPEVSPARWGNWDASDWDAAAAMYDRLGCCR